MADEPAGATEERRRFASHLPALAAHLAAAGLIQPGSDLAIERVFEAGQSNPTYLLAAKGCRFVLRKQPYGHLLPRAHDVLREHAIVEALHAAGLAVPRPLLAGRDRAVIGTDFAVMAFVPGAVYSNPALPGLTPEARTKVYDALATGLADLHAVDPQILQAAGIKMRTGFVARQVATWRAAYLASETQPDGRVGEVADWLIDHVPAAEGVGIVHGDYRIENVIFDGARLAAILDWELCTIGEPMADLAYCCLWYHMPPEVLNGLADLDLAGSGIPTEARFLEVYERSGGIDARPTHAYFLSFAFFRLAAILQGVYRRALDGNAASPQALSRGDAARFCLDRAARFAERA